MEMEMTRSAFRRSPLPLAARIAAHTGDGTCLGRPVCICLLGGVEAEGGQREAELKAGRSEERA